MDGLMDRLLLWWLARRAFVEDRGECAVIKGVRCGRGYEIL